MKILSAGLLWTLASLMLFGMLACSDPYKDSLRVGDVITSTVPDAMKTVVDIRTAGLITKDEAGNALDYIHFVDLADRPYIQCVQDVHTSSKVGGLTSCANDFLSQLNDPAKLALIHVSESQGQAKLNVLIGTLTTGLTTLVSSLGGA